MFASATLKLTGWYLLILMGISLIFSIAIYSVASGEIDTRLGLLQSRIENLSEMTLTQNPSIDIIRDKQMHEAEVNMLVGLAYINICILILGGIGSYLLARRTLAPIEAAHEAQSRFTSDASHELRTPLAVMKTELEVALRDPNLNAVEMRELLESNLEEVEKLSKLSQTLLSLSRLDYHALDHELMNFSELVREVVRRYDKSGSRVEIVERGKELFITAHPSSIEELITVLVDNALKYSPVESTIKITLSKKNNFAKFEIVNAGKGIASEDLVHIFDRFYRADNSRTTTTKTSFGLGLSLAKTIVKMHNGQLSVSSGLGQDTTFTVLLPTKPQNSGTTQNHLTY